MMARATLLAGGNLGDVAAALEQARALIEQQVGTIVRATSVHRTAAWGMEQAPDFLNRIWVVETPLAPEALLDAIEAIERQLGRTSKGKPYRSRTMDIDILYYDHLRVETPRLTIPHPLIGQRKFVLELLDELD